MELWSQPKRLYQPGDGSTSIIFLARADWLSDRREKAGRVTAGATIHGAPPGEGCNIKYTQSRTQGRKTNNFFI